MMKNTRFKLIKRFDSKKILVEYVETREALPIHNDNVEHMIKDGLCNSLVEYSTDEHFDRFYIKLHYCNGAELYYTGFNFGFLHCIGVSTNALDTKIYRNFNKALKKAKRLSIGKGFFKVVIEGF